MSENDEQSHSELPPSSSDKWFHCHAWRRLNHGLPDQSSAAADEGTLAHARLAAHLLGQQDLDVSCKGVEEMYDHLMQCAEWLVDQPGNLHVEHEVDFGAAFGYSDLTGTSDAVIVHDKHLTIADLKYGRGMVEVVEDDMPNTQLMCYLVGAVHQFGRRERYRLAILQPRAWHEDGPIREHWVTDETLRVFEAVLDKAIQANYNPKSEPRVGPYCRKFCKALGRCEAAAKHSLALLRFAEDDA